MIEPALVDVILPTYNCGRTLEEAVTSVVRQTIACIRVIVIDDGSTDETPAVLAKLAQADRRIVVIRKPNSGIVEALNVGLSHVSAPYVARQDADDRSMPDRFARQIAVFKASPNVVAVSGACLHIDKSGTPTGVCHLPGDPDRADALSIPSKEPYLLHPFLMVRREAYAAVGGYRYVLNAEDTDLYWRLQAHGRLVNMPAVLGEMRLHDRSVSNASIVNGRIMAIHSQLAAISARRRRTEQTDLQFGENRMAGYVAARSLERMIKIASVGLTESETGYLRFASAAKLLELAARRSYEIDVDDCRYIRSMYKSLRPASFRGSSVCNWAYRTGLIRLMSKGLLREAWALLDFRVLAQAILMRLFPK